MAFLLSWGFFNFLLDRAASPPGGGGRAIALRMARLS